MRIGGLLRLSLMNRTVWLGFVSFALMVSLLSGCAPKGAKNWPFSIGPQTFAVALGDMDGDGDLDAFLANGENEVPVPNTVWWNDGAGNFRDSGQQIGDAESHSVLLEDMDQDGDLDALVANTGTITLFFNTGQGVFGANATYLSQDDFGAYVLAPAIGDVNRDGWLDVIAGGCCGAASTFATGAQQIHPSHDSLWISDGQGQYIASPQTFDAYGTQAVALGDLDGDGDLDAFFANAASLMGTSDQMQPNQPDTVWINDGQGSFTQSNQSLSTGLGQAVALGNLDGDSDLDALVGNRETVEVWLNQGAQQGGAPGTFAPGAWQGNLSHVRALFLDDLDADGDLDVLAAGQEQALVWLNNGQAAFSAGAQFAFEPQHALALGDLNGDGFPDVFAGSVNHGLRVWLNDGQGVFQLK